jgi:histone-binding protein RBBP4
MAEEQQSQQKEAGLDGQVDEDYAVWRKNTPFLYDLVISHHLEWPPLTVHWAPIPAPLPHASDPSLAVHRLVLGTHTAEGSPSFLMVADCSPPQRSVRGQRRWQRRKPHCP